jgi:hypothetical protein
MEVTKEQWDTLCAELHMVAGGISAAAAGWADGGPDEIGGRVESLAEAVTGVTAGLVRIADSIGDPACAIREHGQEVSPHRAARSDGEVSIRPDRQCGGCSACCSTLHVKELGKPEGQRCEHQCDRGCAIHGNGKPEICKGYLCMWRLGVGEDSDRPDRGGLLLHPSIGQELCVYELREGALSQMPERLRGWLGAVMPQLKAVAVIPFDAPREPPGGRELLLEIGMMRLRVGATDQAGDLHVGGKVIPAPEAAEFKAGLRAGLTQE